MNAYLSRLNPVERRFVIGVGLLFFIVINVFWVRPHFADWGNLRGRLDAARSKQVNYRSFIQQVPRFQRDVVRLSGEGVLESEDQSIRFLQTIQSQGYQSGVSFNFPTRQITSTNQFFIEQQQTISVSASEKQIVDFLLNIGSGTSLIRARAMSLRPDPNHYLLSANITLVASYQKKPRTTRTSTPAPSMRTPANTGPTPAAPSTKPSATALPKPATPAAKPATPVVRTNGQTSGPAARRSDEKASTLPRK